MVASVSARVALRIPATRYPVERFTLPNGLRVVLTPDRSAPVVGVAVVYDVGIRSEPQGRSGFAHLFEHLMFQGSENLEKLAHFRYVQGSGGTFNGSTHFDYTDYFETLPANALERALFLEAGRRGGLAGTGSDRRPRRVPALRGTGRGADRRRRVPSRGTPGAQGPRGDQPRRVHRLHGRTVRRPVADRARPAGAPAARR